MLLYIKGFQTLIVCLSAFTFGQYAENFVEEVAYSPDHAPEPVLAVADMLAFLFPPNVFLAAEVADFIIIMINMIFFIKR